MGMGSLVTLQKFLTRQLLAGFNPTIVEKLFL